MASLESYNVVHSSSSTSSEMVRQTRLGLLITYFVTAKKSLATVAQVRRVSEIVAAARANVESLAETDLSNGSLAASLSKQLEVAKSLVDGMTLIDSASRAEFEVIVLPFFQALTFL